MNWEAIGAIAEMLGSIGVLATLIYLAIQIRVNSREVSDNTVQQVLERSVANLSDSLIAGHEPLLRRFSRGEELTLDELWTLVGYVDRNLLQGELVFYQYQKGRIDQELMDVYDLKTRMVLALRDTLEVKLEIPQDGLERYTASFGVHLKALRKETGI